MDPAATRHEEVEFLNTLAKQKREEQDLNTRLPVFLSSENDPEAAYKVVHPYTRSSHHAVHLHRFTNERGHQLAYVAWIPTAVKTKGVLIACHGFNHRMSDAFDLLAGRMTKLGYAVWGFDYAGCGRSEGLRGYIPSFDELAKDVRQFTRIVKSHYEGSADYTTPPPMYLYGESLGGAIGILADTEEPALFNGLILCVPLLGLSDKMRPNPVFRGLLSVLSRCFPRLTVPPPTNHIDLCFQDFNRKEMLELYEQDSLMYKKGVRLKTAYHLVKVANYLRGRFKHIESPVLILQGTGDQVVNHKLAETLIDESPSKDKTLIYYEGGCHVLPFDRPFIREYLHQDVVQWLDQHVEGEPKGGKTVVHRPGTDEQ